MELIFKSESRADELPEVIIALKEMENLKFLTITPEIKKKQRND